LSLPKGSVSLIRAKTPIPPSEAGRKVVDERLMMEVMMIGSSPERDELV